jgi:hypothetical protein
MNNSNVGGVVGLQSLVTNLQNAVVAINNLNTSLQSYTVNNNTIYTYLISLPTTNPGASNKLWWNAGVLTRT